MQTHSIENAIFKHKDSGTSSLWSATLPPLHFSAFFAQRNKG
jgi:hypothetical protein